MRGLVRLHLRAPGRRRVPPPDPLLPKLSTGQLVGSFIAGPTVGIWASARSTSAAVKASAVAHEPRQADQRRSIVFRAPPST